MHIIKNNGDYYLLSASGTRFPVRAIQHTLETKCSKIKAIQITRAFCNSSLKDTKDAIDLIEMAMQLTKW